MLRDCTDKADTPALRVHENSQRLAVGTHLHTHLGLKPVTGTYQHAAATACFAHHETLDLHTNFPAWNSCVLLAPLTVHYVFTYIIAHALFLEVLAAE